MTSLDNAINVQPEIDIHKMTGPLLLLAGPGTGKTYQLARRIKFLVEEEGVDPESITVITFTAAAAANMRERISDPKDQATFISKDLQPEMICTMHSFGFRIVRENAEHLGLPTELSVIQSDEARRMLLGDAAQIAGYKRSDAEKAFKDRQRGISFSEDSQESVISQQYSAILRTCNAIDYDDQIFLACDLLENHGDKAETYRSRAKHLLVDEYQDINAAQFQLIQALSENQRDGLFVVGDDDQSIYSWRGGSPRFIRNFETHFGASARVESLLHSRRCHEKVLQGSINVVENYDTGRRMKGDFTYESSEGPPIVIHNVPSDKREAGIIVEIIQASLPSKSVLVLVPNRRYATLICERLRKARIKFSAPEPPPGSGLLLLERLTSWLQDDKDNIALRECIEAVLGAKGTPVPGPRVKKVEKIQEREQAYSQISHLWKVVLERRVPLWQALEENSDKDNVLELAHSKINGIKTLYDTKQLPELLKHVGESLRPWNEVCDFVQEIENWVSRFGSSSVIASDPVVRIMTFQGAKGLQAKTVCVVGLEDGTIPRANCDSEELSESARLLFVSMTRAEVDLHLFHCRSRSGAVSFQNRNQHGQTLNPSSFLDAIPPQCCKKQYHPPNS